MNPLVIGMAALVAMLSLAGCERPAGPLEKARRSGELVVITRYGSSTYYEGRDGPDGFEHALSEAFASHLGLRARFVVMDSIGTVLEAMDKGAGSMAAAGLTRTDSRERWLRFGPDYMDVQQQVVCRRGIAQPQSVDDLVGVDLLVLADSSYEERLVELKADQHDLGWRRAEDQSDDEILERVWKGDADCTIADSNVVDINRRYFPELSVAFPVSEVQQLAWVLPRDANRLSRALEDWMESARESGLLDRLYERFYGHVTLFDYVDLRAYIKRIDERLPRFEEQFRKSAVEHSLPWTLLAAVSYQESHWDPRARSPTGVRGMMMLTRATARALGVRDRTDPVASIEGGARYLARLMERVPEEVTGPDRVWFALAAYNVGFGHLSDARRLAHRLGRNPNVWHDLKAVLPLLSRRRFYATLRHGYARGSEPVRYVERVRNYLDILERVTFVGETGS